MLIRLEFEDMVL
uniref:Uncharacterized protein n=1 Tax=Anguilla anguilla TaxID=7936 RepID=A0A0E9TYM5_ANGAN